jgi:hypothetical protein
MRQLDTLDTWTSLTIPREQATSLKTQQNYVRVVPPEDGRVMPETCQGFEFQ